MAKKMSRREFFIAPPAMAMAMRNIIMAKNGRVQNSKILRKKPNIVIILADDQRFDDLECMGHPFAKNPNLNRLVKEGFLFSNAVVSTPLCGPNRASLFTGCFAHNHGLRHHGEGITAHKEPIPMACFPALFRDAGYETALFGKFHDGERYYPDHGFTHFELARNPYINPEFLTDNKWEKYEGHVDQIICSKATKWIKKIGGQAPFLIVLSHFAPHMPIIPPKEYENLYSEYTPMRRPNVNDICGDDKAKYIQDAQNWFRSMRKSGDIPEWTWPFPFSDEQLRHRARLNQVLDDSVGAIYQTLAETGILNETLIIYHSDNGYFLGEHGLSEKYYPYEEALRVPLIIRCPWVENSGKIIDRPVYTIDICPTLLDLAGLESPSTIDGSSLLPLIEDKKQIQWRNATIHEFFYHQGPNPDYVWQSVRTENFKYIRFQNSQEEFYNLKEDPYEMKNIALENIYKNEINRYRQLLDHLFIETRGKPIALKNPAP